MGAGEMNRKEKKQLREKRTVQQLMGIKQLTRHGVLTANGELVFFLISPDNLSILSGDGVRGRITALSNLLQGIDNVRLLALDSQESFQQNLDYYRQRLEQETNPAIRELLCQDLEHLTEIQTTTASAREFAIVIPLENKTNEPSDAQVSRLEKDKAKWLAGAALTAADQAMSSVISTVLSRLNAFLDSEIEQLLCFDSAINAEEFVKNKSAIFLILPEEDPVKNFIAALMIQNLSRELFAVADEHGGKLPNRAIMYCDEFGTMPPFDVLPLFSAGRSRRLTLVPIIQSLAQLEKNYGREGAEILVDNCQDTIFGGFAPQSQTAEKLSQSLGKRTVLSGYVSKGQGGASTTSQMIERPLMTPDELKSMPKGNFIIMKTGTHPAKTRLKLFLEWGITFKEPYSVPEQSKRKIYYASRKELELAIRDKFSSQKSAQVNDAEQEILKKEKR